MLFNLFFYFFLPDFLNWSCCQTGKVDGYSTKIKRLSLRAVVCGQKLVGFGDAWGRLVGKLEFFQ